MERKKTKLLPLFVVLLFCGAGAAFGDWDEGGPHKMHYPQLPKEDGSDGGARIDNTFGKMPLYFIENQGQLDADVGLYVQGSDKTLYFTPQGVTFALTGKTAESKETQRWSVKLDFVGANPDVRPIGEDRQQAVISYFKGKPEDCKTGLATYSRVVYPELWDGIDLVYSGSVNQLKYKFVVKPGADTKQIRLAYRGAENVIVKETGELMVETPLGGFADAAPYAYQEMNGQRTAVSMAYTLEEGSCEGIFEYCFDIGPYDINRPLILDPAVLLYCGYIGGADYEGDCYGIAVDDFGNAYVTGTTESTEASFPVVVGPDLTHNGGTDDAFVAKVNAAGTALLYCGYIGGDNYDEGWGIAVDEIGNAYVTGRTYSSEASFPVVVGPDLTHNGGEADAFVAKVNADGTALLYCGYIGGSGYDEGWGIAVDEIGNAYVMGTANSSEVSFPVAVGPDLSYNGGVEDAFVAKVKVDGTALDYCGYIGGVSDDYGYGIAVDAAGNAYVAGMTYSTEASFPVVVGPDLSHNGGGPFDFDAFVAKVNAAGTALDYCGYIGGDNYDKGWGISVDEIGNAYVMGDTLSSEASFPVLVGPDLTLNGGQDAFVAKVNTAGTALLYCGYIGGNEHDEGFGIAVDDFGNSYAVGWTSSTETSFPVVVGPDLTFNGDADAFVVKVNAAGTALDYCGYIGGGNEDYGYGIAVDAAGNAYVAGSTASTEANFPVVVGPDLTHNGGSSDAFVAKVVVSIKWLQEPDLTPDGMDIRADRSDGTTRILADDFECTKTGSITKVKLWGSWKNDVKGQIEKFHLSIHDDKPDPDGPGPEYSEPNTLLWSKVFFKGEFTETLFADLSPDYEWWWDPVFGTPNSIGDQQIWLYEITIDPNDAFVQEGTSTNPIIYWLDAGVEVNEIPIGAQFGWKTSPDHWNDDSVFWDESLVIWQELRYPPEHSFDGNSIDLAFAIITDEQEEPNEPAIKWIQNPDLNNTGIDVDASVDFTGMAEWPDHILADDFNCTRTDPITDIHIWGSWYKDILPLGDPNNVVFFLFIHEDLPVGDPCNPYDYSIPGEILWDRPFGPGEFQVAVEAADITEGYYVPGEPYYEPDADWTCWRYDFYIDPCEAFIQQGTANDPCIYWLSAHAGTDSEFSPARFGWKTSLEHWNDDAVFLALGPNEPDPNWQELRYPQGHQLYGDSIDLAFSITTGQEPNEANEPEPEEPNFTKPLMPHTKWSQPPIEIDPNSDEPNYCGWDEASIGTDIWCIVADDFRCLGTMPITSIHWWGSYLNWEGNEPPPVHPEEWQIGFWSNIADPDPCNPDTFSHPNELLWQIDIEPNQTTDINLIGEPCLISYWRFNEGFDVNVYDSANGNDGTIYPKYNVDSMWTIGKEGSALYFHGGGQFDSSADEVRVPHSTSLDITGPFTVEAWIKAEGTRKYHAIVDKYDGSPTLLLYGFTLYLTDGNLRLSIYGGTCGNGNMAVPLIDLRDNMWHHVAGSWDGNDIKLYIDGELEAENPCPCAPASTTHDLGIGKRLYGWGGYLPFEGTIDEVAIYDVNLTDDVIKKHYEGGSLNYVDVEKCGDIYQYSLQLEPTDYFWQYYFNELTEDDTFWMSIMAVYPNDVFVEFPWGWHTKPWHWMDDAVVFSHDPCTGPLMPGMTLDPCYIEPIKDPCGESFDMTFELDTDPNFIKWEQLYTGNRDWPHYEDVNSIFSSSDPNGDRFVADDWRCVQRTPITAIVWWGSYIGYGYEACRGPVPRPVQPDLFWLAIWTDVPAGADPCYTYSHPGEEIWGYEAFEYDEVLVGYDKHPHGEPNEPVFRYSVRLPEENWFHQPDYNEVFWLSVQAIYDINQPNYLWGWTNHEHVFNDDAVQGHEDELRWVWDKLKDQTGASADMSFMLFTDPVVCVSCPDYNIDFTVNFIDYADFADDWAWTGPVGGYNNSDLNCNGTVDTTDLALFVQVWLEPCL